MVYDRSTRRIDHAATAAARAAERAARKARGKPFKEFFAAWVTREPPADLPYYGSWGDDQVIYAGAGASRVVMRGDDIQPVWLPDPREVRIAELEARLAALSGEAERT